MPSDETRRDTKLQALIRHLVLSFPKAAILSRSVQERYHVCVIVPYDGSPEKALQVERTLCRESARSIQEFERFLFHLNLPLIFQTHERYDVGLASPPEPSTSPANAGWPAASIGGTVGHGPHPLPSPLLPTSPDALFPLCAN